MDTRKDTRQEPLFFDRVEDAIDHAVRACGGRKHIACKLWPEKPPRDAHNLLDACLNPERREKLDANQILYVMRAAREAGCHALAHYIADESGYERAKPRSRQAEVEDLQKQVIAAAKMIEAASRRLRDLNLPTD